MYRFTGLLVLIFMAAACRENLHPLDQYPDTKELQLTYYDTGLPASFNALYFTDAQHGYLAGNNGGIYHTADGGATWETQTSPTILPLCNIYFLNPQEGFAVGGESYCGTAGCQPSGAVMLHTKDGGRNWQKVAIPNTQKVILKSICFTTDSAGYAVGGATILTTRDRGNSWQETILTELNGHMTDIEFADAHTGLIACSAGKLLRTVDGGLHWTASTIFDGHEIYSLSKVDEHTLYLAGDRYIGKSEDFGVTWETLPRNPGDVFTLNFKTSELGYAFGGRCSEDDPGRCYGSMYYTRDGGTTWTTMDKLTKVGAITASFFPTENMGYAVSGNTLIRIERKEEK